MAADASRLEITLEANPTSVEAGRFARLPRRRRDPRVAGRPGARRRPLRFLGREHSAARRWPPSSWRPAHFARHSFDLIYARPGQTVEAWEAELRRAWPSPTGTCRSISSPSSPARFLRHGAGPLCRSEDDRQAPSTRLTQDAARRPPACRPTRSPTMPGRAGFRHNCVYWRYGDYARDRPRRPWPADAARAPSGHRPPRVPERWLTRWRPMGTAKASGRPWRARPS